MRENRSAGCPAEPRNADCNEKTTQTNQPPGNRISASPKTIESGSPDHREAAATLGLEADTDKLTSACVRSRDTVVADLFRDGSKIRPPAALLCISGADGVSRT